MLFIFFYSSLNLNGIFTTFLVVPSNSLIFVSNPNDTMLLNRREYILKYLLHCNLTLILHEWWIDRKVPIIEYNGSWIRPGTGIYICFLQIIVWFKNP